MYKEKAECILVLEGEINIYVMLSPVAEIKSARSKYWLDSNALVEQNQYISVEYSDVKVRRL